MGAADYVAARRPTQAAGEGRTVREARHWNPAVGGRANRLLVLLPWKERRPDQTPTVRPACGRWFPCRVRVGLRGPTEEELPVQVEIRFRAAPSLEAQFGEAGLVPIGVTVPNVEFPTPGGLHAGALVRQCREEDVQDARDSDTPRAYCRRRDTGRRCPDAYEPIGTIGAFSVKGQTAARCRRVAGALGAEVFDNGECLMDETRKYGMWAE